MALVIPDQERSVDPYSSNRYSSVINRLTRCITGGYDVILHPLTSFQLTRISNYQITVSPGVCIKNDVTIHIYHEDYIVDFSDPYYYIDTIESSTPMDTTGYYYIVLQYQYSRSLPTPKDYYKIIKNINTYYTPYTDSYIFLGCAHVIATVGSYSLDLNPNCIKYEDPENTDIKRPTQGMYNVSEFILDGGDL
jgi:hypothetical protein